MARHLRGDAGLRRLLLWPQVGRVWLGRCLARLPMSRARTSPMAGSLA